MKRVQMKLVEVVWTDASMSGGWSRERRLAPSECISVGWITGKTKKTLTLAASRNDDGQIGDRIAIPRSTIRSIRRTR